MDNQPGSKKVINFTEIKGVEISSTQNNAMEALREKMLLRKKAIEIANLDKEYDGPTGP